MVFWMCWWISRYMCHPLEAFHPLVLFGARSYPIQAHPPLSLTFSFVFVNICSPPTPKSLLVGHLYARFARELNLTCYSFHCQRNKPRVHERLPLPVDETSYSIDRDERLILFDRNSYNESDAFTKFRENSELIPFLLLTSKRQRFF